VSSTLDGLSFTRTSRHEAGHAVGACRLGMHLHHVTIVPNEKAFGHARFAYDTGDTMDSENGIIVRLLGYLAETSGPIVWPPDYADALDCGGEELGQALRELGTTRERYIRLCAIAMDFASEPLFQREVELVAEGLREFGYLTRAEVEVFMAAAE
jgi:hypothetical protein